LFISLLGHANPATTEYAATRVIPTSRDADERTAATVTMAHSDPSNARGEVRLAPRLARGYNVRDAEEGSHLLARGTARWERVRGRAEAGGLNDDDEHVVDEIARGVGCILLAVRVVRRGF